MLAVSAFTGCSSDSTTGAVVTDDTVTASLGTSVKNIPLTQGVPAEIKFTYTVPGDITSRGDYSVDLTKTLNQITLSSSPVASKGSAFETLRLLAFALVKEAFAAETAQITAYISHAGDPNVCSSPYAFGPYSIMGAIGEVLSSDTASVEPSQAAVDIVNAGSFEICVVTTPPITAYLTVTGVEMDVEDCAPPTVDIVGTWSGTFWCDNFGIPDTPADTPVSFDVTLNPDGSYHYYDGVADYDGYLCGNTYRFNGGASGDYTESGTMVVNGNSASKTSNWQDVTSPYLIHGRCYDDLNKT
jgi:hypothetical protein